jgi:hypothetical protein
MRDLIACGLLPFAANIDFSREFQVTRHFRPHSL